MANGHTRSLSYGILQWALALFLIASGVWAVQSDSGFFANITARINGNEPAEAVLSLSLDKGIQGFIILAFGIIEIVGGVFIIIDFFTASLKGTRLILFIVVIAWIIITVLLDFVAKGVLKSAFKNFGSFLRWIHDVGLHLLVIGGLLTLNKGKN
jgi:uncharacterized membrane protein YphA (DoxX/SURF4 family)